jgi:hypothetical protein
VIFVLAILCDAWETIVSLDLLDTELGALASLQVPLDLPISGQLTNEYTYLGITEYLIIFGKPFPSKILISPSTRSNTHHCLH